MLQIILNVKNYQLVYVFVCVCFMFQMFSKLLL